MADKFDQIWDSLQDEEYRREFAEDVATGLAFQIRALRENAGWTQEELAQRIGKRQETISLWENPNYANYTLKTLKSLAGAFDLVPVFRLGAFSEMVEWNVNLTASRIAPPSFRDEHDAHRSSWANFVGFAAGPPMVSVAGLNIMVNYAVGGLPMGAFVTTAAPPEGVVSAETPTKRESSLAVAA